MINYQVDIKRAVDRLTKIQKMANVSDATRMNIPSLIEEHGKRGFANASIQRINTNRPPSVGGPYNTGKKLKISKYVKATLNPETFFVAFTSRVKNTATVNIGIDLTQKVGLPLDKFSASTGEWSAYMADKIPYNFAGPAAAEALLIRHFGTGTYSLKPGYGGKRLYPNNWRIFAQITNKRNPGDIRNKFITVERLEQELERAAEMGADRESMIDGYDDEDPMKQRILREVSRGGADSSGESSGGYISSVLQQLGDEGLEKIMSSASWANIQTATGKSIILWHKGVPSYGWFRDYNFQTYASDVQEIKDLIDKIIKQVIGLI